MTRRICLFILIIFLVNLVGFFGFFLIRLNQIHEESREALKFLPDSELDHFTLNPEEYQAAIINEREILIHDRMYDVARIVITEHQVDVYALHDEAEDDLLAFIKEVTNNAEKDGPAPSIFSQFASLQFLIPPFGWNTERSEKIIHHQTAYIICRLNTDFLILSPPPRSV